MFDQTTQSNPYNGQFAQYNGMPQQSAKVMNVLTAEEMKMLMQQKSEFSLSLTPLESLQAACSHRREDGLQDSLTYDPIKGVARCTICGYEFRPIEPDESPESIQTSVDRIVDILHTIKILYTDIPGQAAREYFQIIPLIEKIPKLFEFAAKNFAKHEYNPWSYNQYNMGGIQMLQNLSSMFGGAMPQQQPFMPQQPMGQPMGQPFIPQQPMAAGFPNAAYGGPAVSPFGYPGASQQQGYTPQTQGYQYNPADQKPQSVAPTGTPTAPEASGDTVTVNNTVNV